ncbi:PH domain-containing protein [Clostridium sp. WILCCON 0269]|uniref:PH domain-containing protein n=1 Tax=Candidatus Clostridium eludens TaxID=3381663 RepID=A0ABW8SIJ6_9CLOT
MKTYKSVKGIGVYLILSIAIIYNILLMFLIYYVDSYELFILLNVTLIAINVYQFYYIIICATLKYSVDEDNLYIISMLKFKNGKIPFADIEMYQKSTGHIKGVKVSGYGKNKFAIGRSFIHKIGITHMFITSTQNVIYLKTGTVSYALSPENFHEFEIELNKRNIVYSEWENKLNKVSNLNKRQKFFIPIIITAIIIIILTFNPIMLYLCGSLPDKMPLSFQPDFSAVKFGTGRQFAFKQMTYGLLNMGVLFCMYYAGYIYSKYDEKTSYKFLYIALVVSVFFLAMQIKILYTFR